MADETERLDDAVKVRVLPAGTPRTKRNSSCRLFRQFIASIVVNLLAFSFGAATGWLSPVETLLLSPQSPVGQLSKEQTALLASLPFLGGILGTLLWGRLADWLGRKMAACIGAAPFIVGWALVLFSSNIYPLYIARILLGFGGSGGLIISPLYVAEIADSSIRGVLGAFVIVFMNSGIVFCYILGEVLSYRILAQACLTIPFLFLTCMYFLPETPTYLLSKGDRQRAERSMIWFRKDDPKQAEAEPAVQNKSKGSPPFSSLFSSRGNLRGTIIGLGLFCFQQYCGIIVIWNFARSILSGDSGSSGGRDAIMVGVAQLIASGLSSTLVERAGRKLLLLFSYFVMFISLFALGLANFMHGLPSWLSTVSLMAYVFSYALGAGPMPYVVISETINQDIRSLAASVFVLWGTALAFSTTLIYPLLITTMGNAGCYWFFSGCCLAGFIFVLLLVPETKGIPLGTMLARLNGDVEKGKS